MISVVLDACVLYSAALRDFLLRLADNKLIAPHWSEEIQNEWTSHLLQNRSDLIREKLERTRRIMDTRFPNGLVRGYESIVSTLGLPDPKDRHVLAAAIHAKAEYIVTFNLRDFPKTVLHPYGIEAVSPDELVLRLIQQIPSHILDAVKIHRLSLTRPSKTVDEYLATLEKQRLPQTVAFLRKHKTNI
jgi:predicted nucleic acid-binding protein